MLQKIRVRSLLMGAAFTLLFIAILFRLYWLQVVESPWLTAKAEAMWGTERTLPGERGTIYDRKMQVMAGDGKGYTVVVNPKVIHEFGLKREVAEGLSEVLDKPLNELLDQVESRNDRGDLRIYREVRTEGWKINEETAQAVRDWKEQLVKEHGIKGSNWQGVVLIPQQMRVYPKNSMAAHIIGFVDKDGAAKSGLELSQDELLRGKPGSVEYKRDGEGQKLTGSQAVVVPPEDGKHLVLTIDQTIQHYTEAAIAKVFEIYKPKNMTAIVLDPNTMEVLAMASAPAFNPNRYWEYDTTKDFTNTAIQSRYEPGSTFKVVTLAAAVDQGVFHPNETFQSGSIRVPGATIRDHRRGGWGPISYLEGLLRSSNVAFVKLGYETLGEKLLREYIERFGFNQKTGIDLPGEIGSVINFHYPSEIAAATYGQGGVIVTPLQQAVAYAAIANGGTLMKPHVIKKVLDPETGEVITEYKPKVLGQVVSKEVAQQVSEYLEQVVADHERGTGKRAYLEGYRVAGKTGTANKVVDGSYSTDKWVVSFIGYAPVNDPRIVVAVVADEPDLGGNSNRAGEVTTPVFKEIMSQSLRYLGIPPEHGSVSIMAVREQEKLMTVPDVHNVERLLAEKELKARGFTAAVIGNGDQVLMQYPQPGEQLPGSPKVYLLTVPRNEAPVPDLTGESLRDVVQMCALFGFKCEAEGEGYVVSQELFETQEEMTLKVYLRPLGDAVQGKEENEPIGPDPEV